MARIRRFSSMMPFAVILLTLTLAAPSDAITGRAPLNSFTRSADSGPAQHRETIAEPQRTQTPTNSNGVLPVRPDRSFDASGLTFPSPMYEGGSKFSALSSPNPTLTFEGIQSSGSVLPDSSGAAGPTQYVEVVNKRWAVFSKSGTLLRGPEPTNSLWSKFGGGCQTQNDGDATVIFDTLAQRWVIQQIVANSTPFLECVAVSATSDATGAWHLYSFTHGACPDYPKLGVWRNAYFVSFNLFSGSCASGSFAGVEYCALNRAAMLSGASATQQCFTGNPKGARSMLPASIVGTTAPPSGEREWFVGLSPDFGDFFNALIYYKFYVDWEHPSFSEISAAGKVKVSVFARACGGGACIPQPSPGAELDSLGDRLMFPLSYRRFGDHESLVATDAVIAGSSSVGMRWYELRVSSENVLSAYQQQTWEPDNAFRWMGSIGMDRFGNMLLGYSISSPTLHPGIRYTSRLATDPLSQMPGGEAVLFDGAGSQVENFRWGDYSQVSIDPADDCTFWYVNEYYLANSSFEWHTKIGAVKLGSC